MCSFSNNSVHRVQAFFTKASCLSIGGLAFAYGALAQEQATGNSAVGPSSRCVIVEIYVADDQAESKLALEAANNLVARRPGIIVSTRTITSDSAAKDRLKRIADYFRIAAPSTPFLYCCNRAIQSGKTAEDFEQQLQAALRVEVFTRTGCQHCAAAKAYLPSLLKKFPGLEVTYRDISNDVGARNALNELVRRHRQAAASTPVFHVCNQLIVGFDRAETTGQRLEQVCERWTANCPAPRPSDDTKKDSQPSTTAVQEVTATAPFSSVR